MTTQLEQQREDQALGAAWRRCVAGADPEFDWVMLRKAYHFRNELPWYQAELKSFHEKALNFDAATPTEALTALAEALEARNAE